VFPTDTELVLDRGVPLIVGRVASIYGDLGHLESLLPPKWRSVFFTTFLDAS
jgi:hypothetical protein